MVQNADNTFTPDFTKQQVTYVDAPNQRRASFYPNKLDRSTYDETLKGRTVTIDWDKNECWDDAQMTPSDLNDVITKLNDPSNNVYNGIVDLNVEGKATQKFHKFVRGQAWTTGVFTDYFSLDTFDARYTFFSFHGGPVDMDTWWYYLPGFGYNSKNFADSDWVKYNHCPSFSNFLQE